jgi:threonyl-tRNA synthetase
MILLRPDGRRLEVNEPGARLGEVLQKLDPALAKEVIGARRNGEVVDLYFKLPEGQEELELITLESDDAKWLYRHSMSHVLAQAVKRLFPGVKLAIGPAIEEGFYYDFDVPKPFTHDDLEAISNEMKKIIKEGFRFERQEVSRQEAEKMLKGMDEPYKLEILYDLPEGEEISFYKDGEFVDLCRGPHVRNTKAAKHFKLLDIAGAYWRGDESRKMLQRIYGTAFHKEEDLEKFIKQREEAARRDHRRLGRELELFHLDPTAPGMPYWLPKGLTILNELIGYWRREHDKRGYQEIASPLINHKSLWETSGHWEYYKDNMFIIPIDEHTTYGVKPMNCPNAMVVFNLKTRSYRDLPLRLSDCDILHRHERSGTLHGLLRVQKIQQDDAHIFVTEDQIEDEYDQILDITRQFYGIFNLKYSLRLGTRPKDFLGDVETWDRAEAALKRILDKHVGSGKYQIAVGDGAFYGPKVDILMEDAIGRSWQMGTIQLDFQLPRRFDCKYIDENNQGKTPVVVHRVIYGSLERFFGIIIEHYAGAFPVWISPIQVAVLPIADRHVPYGEEVYAKLKEVGIRTEMSYARHKTLSYRVRDAQVQKIPYMLVLGDREQESGEVAVRLRTEQDLGAQKLEAFIAMVQEKISKKEEI